MAAMTKYWGGKKAVNVLGSVVSLSQTMAHEAGKQRQHHFWIHLHQVIWQGVDTGTDLAGQGDSIPGREPRLAELGAGSAEQLAKTNT